MGISYSLLELFFYFLLYSFLGWVVEVAFYAVARRRFYNRGFTTMPFLPSCGAVFVLLLLVLPTLGGNYVLQFIDTLIILWVVDKLSLFFFQRLSPHVSWEPERESLLYNGRKKFAVSIIIAAAYYLTYLVIHPLIMTLTLLIPRLLLQTLVIVFGILLVLDIVTVICALRSGNRQKYQEMQKQSWQRKTAAWVSNTIWNRLQKDYPGIRQMTEEEIGGLTFARGVCLDKLIWVFLFSALLGDIIETFFCGFVNGAWMNRSSVLYGPFSFVWGFGAVLLTITLQRFAEKGDRYVFLAGFVIGGAYEYMCSVFTELVFGTVFWDYSNMPLNIGGRTNVLFCFFWGVLAVVWIKIVYPPMSRSIEKLPPLVGKIFTWVTVFVMLCNGILTVGAMVRYDTRRVRPEPANIIEKFLDSQYDDEYMESRWPNMIVTEKE